MAVSLAGRTLFITGASRGIGLSIALRAAADGANVVIAAKTTEPHPTLPGTIYTAAKEVEAAGGKCFPCAVDIRHEDQVSKAVEEAVRKFGGIDILINNASAISLTGTDVTPMKKYDLMHSINGRGTYLCSKVCLPYLKKSSNPHILNISPPLDLQPKWFQNHVAYTIAKYNMSLCALGMAAEFAADGIAVNTLWPRTAIYTAAMSMLAGGEGVQEQCRKPEIMSDAAYSILTKDSKSFTGNFCIDDEVLYKDGVTDLEKYSYKKDAVLLPDFFVEGTSPDALLKQLDELGQNVKYRPAAAAPAEEQPKAPSGAHVKTFDTIQAMLSEEAVASIKGSYAFDLKEDGIWHLDLKSGSGSAGEGEPPSGKADVTFTMTSEKFAKMFEGKLNPTQAFMMGQMKIKGDLGLAMKLEKLMKKMRSSKL